MAWQAATTEPATPGPGPYEAVWERKRLPDPGAQNYAWESLGLEPFSPIGPSVRTRTPIVPTAGQVYVPSIGYWLTGMPTVQGGIVFQPLFDPQSGFVASLPNPVSALVPLNIPASLPEYGAQMRNNTTNPTDVKGGL